MWRRHSSIMIEAPPPFNELWFRLLVGFIIGSTLGSFITMLSYRLPQHLSIVMPPSHCPSCQKDLKSLDLIPIFSWLIARGKCRYCGVSFGVRYFLIEVATAVITALAFGAVGFRLSLIPLLLLIILGMTSLIIFLERKKN